MSEDVERALALMLPLIPPNTTLTIEETNGRIISKYIVRLVYKSLKSDRCICITAKGDKLPESLIDEVMTYYLRQLVLTPQDINREFSRVYFLERRARQEAFLFGGGNIRVVDKNAMKDRIDYKEYA